MVQKVRLTLKVEQTIREAGEAVLEVLVMVIMGEEMPAMVVLVLLYFVILQLAYQALQQQVHLILRLQQIL